MGAGASTGSVVDAGTGAGAGDTGAVTGAGVGGTTVSGGAEVGSSTAASGSTGTNTARTTFEPSTRSASSELMPVRSRSHLAKRHSSSSGMATRLTSLPLCSGTETPGRISEPSSSTYPLSAGRTSTLSSTPSGAGVGSPSPSSQATEKRKTATRTDAHLIVRFIVGPPACDKPTLPGIPYDYTFTNLRLQHHTTTPWYWQYAGEPIWEMFWRADLTDQEIVIGQNTWRISPGEGPTSQRSAEAMLAYIKVVPLSDDELSEYQADLAQTENKRLFTHNDAGTIGAGTSKPEHLRRAVDIYGDTDFSRVYWEAGSGDRLNYFSKIGERGDDGIANVARLPTTDESRNQRTNERQPEQEQ